MSSTTLSEFYDLMDDLTKVQNLVYLQFETLIYFIHKFIQLYP